MKDELDFTPDLDSEAEDCDTDSILTFEAVKSDRLDRAVSEGCDISRAVAAKYIACGKVSVCGVICTAKSADVKCGNSISVSIPKPCDCTALPENIPVEIVYEDSDIIIVNKPKGMVVHPAPGNYTGTLVNALLYHCEGRKGLSGINGVIRPGIVHRIDKDTSGLLAVAKNDAAHEVLSAMIKRHDFKRIYKALLIGTPREWEGTVDAPIGRNPNDRKKMTVTKENSRNAVTHYRVLESYSGFSYCEMKLETGRTHQIRVHMAHIGHPVVGDPLYAPSAGKNVFHEEGQFLHAAVLGFKHPISGEYMEFESPIPKYFEAALEKLRSEQG